MLKALSELRPTADIDVVCGASVGSLNGALYVQESMKRLEEIWTNIGRRDIYWPVPTLWSLVWNKPLRNLIKREVYPAVLRKKSTVLLPQACRYQDSSELISDQWDDDFLDALLASASIPVIFPATKIRDQYYVDGGVVDNTPLMPILRYFVESQARDLLILMLHTDPQVGPKQRKGRPRLIPQMLHTVQLLLKAGQNDDVRSIHWFNEQQKHLPPEKRKRVRVREIWPVEKIGTLEFSKRKCRDGFNTAYRAAQNRLQEVFDEE
jgi:predicted acylesterase/phospholipase RssA